MPAACVWSTCHALETVFLDGLLKAILLFYFSGITTSITHISAACAFITRDQQLSSSKTAVSSDQTAHSQIQHSSTTFLSSAGGRSRLPFEDVSKPRRIRTDRAEAYRTITHHRVSCSNSERKSSCADASSLYKSIAAPVKLSRDQYLMGSNNASWTLSKAHNVDGLTRSSRTCPVSALLRPESCRTERLHMLSPCFGLPSHY